MLEPLISGFFLLAPVALLAFLGISIYRYAAARAANKRTPGTYSEREIGHRKTLLILSGILTGAVLVVVIGFTILLIGAIAYM